MPAPWNPYYFIGVRYGVIINGELLIVNGVWIITLHSLPITHYSSQFTAHFFLVPSLKSRIIILCVLFFFYFYIIARWLLRNTLIWLICTDKYKLKDQRSSAQSAPSACHSLVSSLESRNPESRIIQQLAPISIRSFVDKVIETETAVCTVGYT